MEDRALSLILAFLLASIFLVLGAWFVSEAFGLQILGQTLDAETLGYLGGIMMIAGGSAGVVISQRANRPTSSKQAHF
jgi:phosphate/sulfate permease